MADEVRLWRIGPGEALTEVRRTPLELELRLQEWLARDISVLDPGLLVIGREVETDYHTFIDMLCIDALGELVIVELKRDRTPREITAQVLDYASWVVDLSHERVTAIANDYLDGGFESAFRQRFGAEVPELLNGAHRMLVVGSQIDASSERIIRYLSGTHGVSINAATFQYFREPGGGEWLARTFLLEPAEVASHVRDMKAAKRRPNLTYEELEQQAQEQGVQELYRLAVTAFERRLQKYTTRSSICFNGQFEGSRKVVLSLLPGHSDPQAGLRYQLYESRCCALTGLSEAQLATHLPAQREAWRYGSTGADPDWAGYQGHLRTAEEVELLASAFRPR